MSAIDYASPLVRAHEGCRLDAYQDQGGIWTIGFGHAGPDVHQGLQWTEGEAEAGLRADLIIAQAGIWRLVPIPLSDRQMGAIVSLAFNVGASALKGSVLIGLIEEARWMEAAHEWIKWDHAGGGESRGLLIRRFDEASLFLKGS